MNERRDSTCKKAGLYKVYQFNDDFVQDESLGNYHNGVPAISLNIPINKL